MFVNPSRAFVEKPSLVASSSGSAKNARYARLLPSTRKRSDSRAGASSSWSSAPVSVFGDISASLRPMGKVELAAFSDEHLEDAAQADGASGAAALRDGRLTGYLIGAPRDPEIWGENVWVDHAGHAVEVA